MRISIIAISIIFISLIISSCVDNKGSFLLINKANEPIVRALIVICGQTIELKDIQPNKNVSGYYMVKSDSHYNIKIEFQSGNKLQREIGYVTNGFDFYHEIVVTNTDIEITKTVSKEANEDR